MPLFCANNFFFVEINLMCASLYLCDFYSCSTTVSYFYKNTIRRAGVIEAACVSIDRFVTFGRRTQTRCLLDRKYSNNCEWISLVWLSLLISLLADGWCCCYYSLLLSWLSSLSSLEWLARHIIANYHGIAGNLLQNTLIRKYIADVNNMPADFMWSDTFAFQSQSSISSHFQSIAAVFNPFAFECLFLCPCASHYRPIQMANTHISFVIHCPLAVDGVYCFRAYMIWAACHSSGGMLHTIACTGCSVIRSYPYPQLHNRSRCERKQPEPKIRFP